MQKFKILPWWYFLIAFLVSLPITAFLLRQNNLKMLELRDIVVQLDQDTGDIKKIEPALEDLRNYSLTHMNASLPAPLELPGSFNVAVDQARKRAEESGRIDGGIYSQAQTECEDASVPLSVRAECIQNFVLSNGGSADDVAQFDIPPRERFIYSYVSPSWSFDLAGIAALVSFTLFLFTAVKFTVDVFYPWITRTIQSDPLE